MDATDAQKYYASQKSDAHMLKAEGYKADFLVVTYVDIQGIKSLLNSFFAPKLAHKWAQTVGAKAE
jgi:hypothetical protein